VFNLCESFICDKKIQSLLFSFVLYVFLGKLFVKVFQSASQFIWDVKTMLFYAFFIIEIFAKACHSFGMKMFSIGLCY